MSDIVVDRPEITMHDHIESDFDTDLDDLTDYISIDPRVMGGMPVIRGTRIQVALILNLIRNDYSFDRIIQSYPHLRQVDIKAALAYAESRIRFERAEVLGAS